MIGCWSMNSNCSCLEPCCLIDAHHAEPIRPVRLGHLASTLNGVTRMPAGQAEYPGQNACTLDTACLQHRFRPACAVWADQTDLVHQPRHPPFDTVLRASLPAALGPRCNGFDPRSESARLGSWAKT